MSKEDLVALNALMAEKNEFKPGQIVEWKSGLKNKRLDGSFVVCEVLAEPIIDASNSAGSPYFMEPLDIILGIVDSDEDFVQVHLDSRRLQPAD